MADEPKIYVVGRESRNTTADILIPSREDTVGRNHIDLTVTPDGRYYISEPKPTTNHTFVHENGSWQKVTARYVNRDTPIRLGQFQTTVDELLRMIRHKRPQATPPPLPTDPSPRPDEPYWDDEAGEFRT